MHSPLLCPISVSRASPQAQLTSLGRLSEWLTHPVGSYKTAKQTNPNLKTSFLFQLFQLLNSIPSTWYHSPNQRKKQNALNSTAGHRMKTRKTGQKERLRFEKATQSPAIQDSECPRMVRQYTHEKTPFVWQVQKVTQSYSISDLFKTALDVPILEREHQTPCRCDAAGPRAGCRAGVNRHCSAAKSHQRAHSPRSTACLHCTRNANKAIQCTGKAYAWNIIQNIVYGHKKWKQIKWSKIEEWLNYFRGNPITEY